MASCSEKARRCRVKPDVVETLSPLSWANDVQSRNPGSPEFSAQLVSSSLSSAFQCCFAGSTGKGRGKGKRKGKGYNEEEVEEEAEASPQMGTDCRN